MISELRIPPGARRRVHSPSLGGRERKAARETKVPDKPWRYRNLSTFQELLRHSMSTFTPPPPAPSLQQPRVSFRDTHPLFSQGLKRA